MKLNINVLMKNYKKHIAFCVFFVLLISLYFFIDPSKSAFFLKCPLKTISGYECAGCGVQRAFHSLLHLRLLEAFKLNPLFVISIPTVVLLWVVYFSTDEKFQLRMGGFLKSSTFVLVVLIIVFVFSFLKNTEIYKDFILNL